MVRLFFLGICFLLTACATPLATNDKASKILSPVCLDLFGSWKYQGRAQSPIGATVYMAMATNSFGVGTVCGIAWGGHLSTTKKQRMAYALQNCEKYRKSWMQKNKFPLSPCVIFSENNNIIYP